VGGFITRRCTEVHEEKKEGKESNLVDRRLRAESENGFLFQGGRGKRLSRKGEGGRIPSWKCAGSLTFTEPKGRTLAWRGGKKKRKNYARQWQEGGKVSRREGESCITRAFRREGGDFEAQSEIGG